MPSRFPTLEDVPLPNVGGPRPVAGYDLSGYARGAQALAQSGQVLGRDIQSAAQDVAAVKVHQDRTNALLAQDQIVGKLIDLNDSMRHDNDPATAMDRYDKQAQTIVDEGLQKISPGPLRDHVSAVIQRPQAHLRATQDERVFQQTAQNTKQDLFDRHNDIVNTTGAEEDPAHTARMTGFNQLVDEYASRRLITPYEASAYKRNLVLGVSQAEITARRNKAIENGDVEGAQRLERELRNSGSSNLYAPSRYSYGAASLVAKAETNDPGIGVKALGNISPDSKGSRSYGFIGLNSASGSAAQFVREHPEFGITARPGSNEFDRQWKDATANKTTDMRKAQLQYFDQHILAPTSGRLQDLGIPSNVAADPRVQAYFADRYTQMADIGSKDIPLAWGNAKGDIKTFLQNMNAIDRSNLHANFHSAIESGVYSLAGHNTRLQTRLEGALNTKAEPDTPPTDEEKEAVSSFGNPMYSLLPPQVRDREISLTRSAQRQIGAKDGKKLNDAITDDLAAAEHAGYGGKLTEADFTRVKGADGPDLYADYQEQMQIAADKFNLNTQTYQEQQDTIHAHEPVPGSVGYAKQIKRYNNLITTADAIQKARVNDPAKAVEKDPAVVEASKNYDPNDASTFKPLGDARLAAQAALGIPEDDQTPITKTEALQLTAQMYRAWPGEEHDAVDQTMAKFVELFGEKDDAWVKPFAFAVHAHAESQAIKEAVGQLMRKYKKGQPITPEEGRDVDNKEDVVAAARAIAAGTATAPTGVYSPWSGTGPTDEELAAANRERSESQMRAGEESRKAVEEFKAANERMRAIAEPGTPEHERAARAAREGRQEKEATESFTYQLDNFAKEERSVVGRAGVSAGLPPLSQRMIGQSEKTLSTRLAGIRSQREAVIMAERARRGIGSTEPVSWPASAPFPRGDDIAELLRSPSKASNFDKQYGIGSAAKILGSK